MEKNHAADKQTFSRNLDFQFFYPIIIKDQKRRCVYVFSSFFHGNNKLVKYTFPPIRIEEERFSNVCTQSIAIISIYQGEKLSLITTNVYQRSIFLSFSLDELKHFSTLIAFEFSNPQSIWIIDRKLISMITNERSEENDKLRVKNRSEMTVS